MNLADAYRLAHSTPSDIYEHVSYFADLVIERNAKSVIELGTRTGVSTAGWLYALQQTDGRLWSVDIDAKPDVAFNAENWTFLQGDDLDPGVFNKLPDEVDIVFIDTSHDYRQTLAELNLYRWKLAPGGLFVLHDTELRRPENCPPFPRYPVKVAMEEFCREEGFEFTNRTNCNGLGVIQT